MHHRPFVAALLVTELMFLTSALTRAQSPPPLLARPAPQYTPFVTMTAEEAKKVAVASYEPEYPVEARRRHLTGSGVLELKLSPDTGEVLSVTVITSTGHSILDRAAIDAFKRWRFRPHMFARVKVPITFSMPKKSGQPAKKT
jgi:protein TonB